MRLVWAYLKVGILELLRYPAFSVPTLAFPGLMFLFFGVPNADEQNAANVIMTSFAIFAVFGVAFFQFGVGIATDRESPWEVYLRTLPVSPQVRFTARVLAALAFALAAVCVVFIVAVLLTPATLAIGTWLFLGLTLLLGSVPIGLMGIALGYWTQSKAALPLANVLWLSLAYAGGLWIPPEFLPSFVAQISPYLPTRLYVESAWAIVLGQGWQLESWLGLLGYTVVAGFFAIWGYRRDQGQKYR